MNENELQIVEYGEQRVVTTKQIADAYETNAKNVTYNFRHNKERFQEGKHYFVVTGEEKQEFINRNEIHSSSKKAKNLYLWTEKGALLLAKSINTDTAWEAYERLVDFYFEKKEVASQQAQIDVATFNTLVQSVAQIADTVNTIVKSMVTVTDELADLKSRVARLENEKSGNLSFSLEPSWYDKHKDEIFYCNKISGRTIKDIVHEILDFLGMHGFKRARAKYIREMGQKPEYELEIVDYFPELEDYATGYLKEIIRLEEIKAGIREITVDKEELEEWDREWDEMFKK